MNTYSEYIDNLDKLSLPELQEISQIIKKIIIEKRRANILNNYFEAEKELQNGELVFSSDVDSLINSLS